MTPVSLSAYLAKAHRYDLLREARQAALAAEATSETGGPWNAVLLMVADLLVDAGRWLRVHLAHQRLAHAHGAPHSADGVCHPHGALPSCVTCVEA